MIHCGTIAVLDRLQTDRTIQAANRGSRRQHFRVADVRLEIALCCDVGLVNGIKIDVGSSFNRIGTDGDGLADAAERNVISGNARRGVLIGFDAGNDQNTVAGNFIGTDATGTAALGNGGDGEAPCYGTIAVNETEFKGTVVNVATIEWGPGLYRDDSPVSQMTRNVLDRLAT